MTAIIEVDSLTKNYGKFTAVDGISFTVDEGAVFGFIGPNGAGKTTTMRIMTTLLTPTTGEVRVGGYSVVREPRDVRRIIGYMPDFFGVYNDMKVWEYLDFFSACYDIAPNRRKKLIDDLLDLVDLAHRRDDQVESLSRGMKQRLCLARTLAHDPKLLILDEPASGLDPRARVEIRELLRELQDMGKTIFFSSHILSEVAEICTHIGIIEAGKIVAYGSNEAIQKQLQQKRLVNIKLADPSALEKAKQALINCNGVLALNDDPPKTADWHLQLEFVGDDEDIGRLLSDLVTQGVVILSFSEEKADLEDMFMQLTKGIVS